MTPHLIHHQAYVALKCGKWYGMICSVSLFFQVVFLSPRVYELWLGLGFKSGPALCCCGRTHHKQHQHHRHHHRHTYTGLMTSHMVSRIPPCAHRGAALRRVLPQLRDFVNPQYLGRYQSSMKPLNSLIVEWSFLCLSRGTSFLCR